MSSTKHYNPDQAVLNSLFVGRRIETVIGGDTLVLDDGTALLVEPNEGGCSCGGGDYALDDIAAFPNAITSVEEVVEDGPDGYSTVYRLFVFSGGIKGQAFAVTGDDGSGYYGTGYHLNVKTADR